MSCVTAAVVQQFLLQIETLLSGRAVLVPGEHPNGGGASSTTSGAIVTSSSWHVIQDATDHDDHRAREAVVVATVHWVVFPFSPQQHNSPEHLASSPPAWVYASHATLTVRSEFGAVAASVSLERGGGEQQEQKHQLPDGIRIAVTDWAHRLQPSRRPPPPQAAATVQTVVQQQTFGIPAAFASRSGGATAQTRQQQPSPYGHSDLIPTGGDGGFARHGGVPAAAVQSPPISGGMMIGPQNPIFFGAGPRGDFGRPDFGVMDPAAGYARFDPLIGPTSGVGFGRLPVPPHHGVFPGEPEADHLRPLTNSNDPRGNHPFGGRGGRGGGGAGFGFGSGNMFA